MKEIRRNRRRKRITNKEESRFVAPLMEGQKGAQIDNI